MRISNADKLLFRAPDISKGQLADYYRRVADMLLPHVRGYALTLQRCPDGIDDCFIQQHAPQPLPAPLLARSLPDADRRRHIRHVHAADADGLVALANLGTVALHRWLSPLDAPRHPNWLIFDLDPGKATFAVVVAAARAVRRALADIDVDSHVMTTGSSGLHVLLRLDGSADFDCARALGVAVAQRVVATAPERFTLEQRIARRGNRVYLDLQRNAYGQTAVAPYSVRALPGAPVATPLEWPELGAATPRRYHIGNLFRRLGQKADPWAGLPQMPGIDASALLGALT